jgi:HemY protein
LRKRKVLPENELDELEQQVLVNHLKQAGAQSPQAQDAIWNKLLKLQRLLPKVACFYAHALWQRGDANTAEAVLRDSLKHHWSSPAVKLYGLINAEAEVQLNHAEKWLKGREKDPLLLVTLARLCIRGRMLGKAQQYLDQSLSWQETLEAYQACGELQMELGENARAAEFYLKGLQLVQNPCVD